jgi:hypothetical protein
MFGRGVHLPAYGLLIRHVNNLKIRNMTTRFATLDSRPALYLAHVERGRLTELDLQVADRVSPVAEYATNDVLMRNLE